MKKLFMTMLLFSFVVSLTWGESGKVTEEEKGKQVISSNKSDFEVTFSSVSSNGTKAKVAETKVKESLDQIKTISPSYKGESYHERGWVWTKTYKIAFFWNKKSRGGAGSPNRADLKKILDSDGIPIGIVTYGAVADFADDYYIVVKQGEKIIHPTKARVNTQSYMTGFGPDTPAYLAEVTATFPYSIVKPGGEITIILVKPEGGIRFKAKFRKW